MSYRGIGPTFLTSPPESVLQLSSRVVKILLFTEEHMPQWAIDAGLPPPRAVDYLLHWRMSDLRRLRNFGKKSGKELKDALEEHGLSLRKEDPAPKTAKYPPIHTQVNIIDPISKILNILSPFSLSVRTRIVRAVRVAEGD